LRDAWPGPLQVARQRGVAERRRACLL